jgi:hypothetical protein
VFLSAPAVARTHVINELSGVDPGTKMMQYNVPIDALWAPVAGSAVLLGQRLFVPLFANALQLAGPANPYNPRRGLAAANHFIGHVEVRLSISLIHTRRAVALVTATATLHFHRPMASMVMHSMNSD